MREKRAASSVLAILAVVIVLVVGIAGIIFTIATLRVAPILEVSGVSIDPDQITTATSATLRFTIKNNDAIKSHSVTVKFDAPSLTFYLNDAKLPSGNDGLQYRQIILQSSEQTTYNFKVTGVLTGGAQRSTYSMNLYFFNENSTKFDTKALSLTVTSS